MQKINKRPRFRVLYFLVIFLVSLIVVGTASVIYAQQVDEAVYRIAVDQSGKMRLLGPDKNGNFNNEPKDNETLIRLPSEDLLDRLVTDLKSILFQLSDNMSELGDKVEEIKGDVNEQRDSITLLNTRSNQLEETVATQTENITALWEAIAQLQSDSGNPGNSGSIITEGLVLYLPLYELQGNSFLSKDTYGHLATVADALWTPQGRYFDGTDDNILLPTTAILQPANGTVIIWMRTDGLAGTRYLISTNFDELSVLRGANTSDVTLYYDSAVAFTIPGTFANAQWVYLGFTFTQGGTGYGYENGVQVVNGACSATAPTSGATRIGTISNAGGWFHKGDIGEVWKYSRALTPAEIQQNYLATKWMYQ